MVLDYQKPAQSEQTADRNGAIEPSADASTDEAIEQKKPVQRTEPEPEPALPAAKARKSQGLEALFGKTAKTAPQPAAEPDQPKQTHTAKPAKIAAATPEKTVEAQKNAPAQTQSVLQTPATPQPLTAKQADNPPKPSALGLAIAGQQEAAQKKGVKKAQAPVAPHPVTEKQADKAPHTAQNPAPEQTKPRPIEPVKTETASPSAPQAPQKPKATATHAPIERQSAEAPAPKQAPQPVTHEPEPRSIETIKNPITQTPIEAKKQPVPIDPINPVETAAQQETEPIEATQKSAQPPSHETKKQPVPINPKIEQSSAPSLATEPAKDKPIETVQKIVQPVSKEIEKQPAPISPIGVHTKQAAQSAPPLVALLNQAHRNIPNRPEPKAQTTPAAKPAATGELLVPKETFLTPADTQEGAAFEQLQARILSRGLQAPQGAYTLAAAQTPGFATQTQTATPASQESTPLSAFEMPPDAALNKEERLASLDLRIKSARVTVGHFASRLKEAIENYKPPMMQISLTLNPQSLGSVEVILKSRGKNLQVSVQSNPQAIALFHQNSAEFRQNLQQMGFSGVDVSFSNENGGQNPQERHKNPYNHTALERDEGIDIASEPQRMTVEIPLYG